MAQDRDVRHQAGGIGDASVGNEAMALALEAQRLVALQSADGWRAPDTVQHPSDVPELA